MGGFNEVWERRRRLISGDMTSSSSTFLCRGRSIWSMRMGLGALSALSRHCELLAVITVVVTTCGCGDGPEKLPRWPWLTIGVNGVVGVEGAFMMRPPHRLQVDPPVGLWLMPEAVLREEPSRPTRLG